MTSRGHDGSSIWCHRCQRPCGAEMNSTPARCGTRTRSPRGCLRAAGSMPRGSSRHLVVALPVGTLVSLLPSVILIGGPPQRRTPLDVCNRACSDGSGTCHRPPRQLRSDRGALAVITGRRRGQTQADPPGTVAARRPARSRSGGSRPAQSRCSPWHTRDRGSALRQPPHRVWRSPLMNETP